MSRTTRARAVRAIAPVAGLLAAGLLVWQGSYAAFSATTPNTGDAWSTGTISLQNNGGTGTFAATTSGVFAETGLKIGDGNAKCITVRSGATSTMPGELRFYRGTITGTNNATLAPQLKVTVEAAPVTTAVTSACGGFPATGVTTLHSAVGLSSLPTDYTGAASGPTLAPAGAMVAYRFTWTLQTTGSNSGDNALQGSSAVADLVWELQ